MFYPFLACKSNSLGVKNSSVIPDAMISAYLTRENYTAVDGRLDSTTGAGKGWCGANGNSWLQIDLGKFPCQISIYFLYMYNFSYKCRDIMSKIKFVFKDSTYFLIREIFFISIEKIFFPFFFVNIIVVFCLCFENCQTLLKCTNYLLSHLLFTGKLARVFTAISQSYSSTYYTGSYHLTYSVDGTKFNDVLDNNGTSLVGCP